MAMNDTRLWEWLDDVTHLMQQVQAVAREDIKNPQDHMDVNSTLHLLVAVHKKVVGLFPADTFCLDYNSVGSCCYRNRNHEGQHMSEWGHTWTDESDAAAASEMVTSMGGKTE